MPNKNPGPGEYQILDKIGHLTPYTKIKGKKCFELS
jgi:hypothetical protein